jgi:hypothetical protein
MIALRLKSLPHASESHYDHGLAGTGTVGHGIQRIAAMALSKPLIGWAGPLAPANSHPARDGALRSSAFSASSNLALHFDRETDPALLKRRRISF